MTTTTAAVPAGTWPNLTPTLVAGDPVQTPDGHGTVIQPVLVDGGYEYLTKVWGHPNRRWPIEHLNTDLIDPARDTTALAGMKLCPTCHGAGEITASPTSDPQDDEPYPCGTCNTQGVVPIHRARR